MGDVITTIERFREALRKLEEAAEEHLARDRSVHSDGSGDGDSEALSAENVRLSGEVEELKSRVAALMAERDTLREENRKLSEKQSDVLKRLDSVIEQVEAAMNGNAAASM